MPLSAQDLASTYSILAFDPVANQLGVAVQSHYFGVGCAVPWIQPGVGAVATQSMVNVAFGPLGLTLLRAGLTPQQALDALLAGDTDPERRQVALMDAQGRTATHTGRRCIPAAGHQRGDNYSVQANLMAKETVWPAMAQAFEQSGGDLAARMLAALKAAEAQGGDIRGKQSAALLVVENDLASPPWQCRIYDLRVDDSREPLAELERLLEVARAYRETQRAFAILEDASGETERLAQAKALFQAAPSLMPDNPEQLFWFGLNLVRAGFVEEALAYFRETYAVAPHWRELPPRLAVAGLLPDDPALIQRIQEA